MQPVTDDFSPALTQENHFTRAPTVVDQFLGPSASPALANMYATATAAKGLTAEAIPLLLDDAGLAPDATLINNISVGRLQELAEQNTNTLLQVQNGDGAAHAIGIHGFDDGEFLIHDPYFQRLHYQTPEALSLRLLPPTSPNPAGSCAVTNIR